VVGHGPFLVAAAVSGRVRRVVEVGAPVLGVCAARSGRFFVVATTRLCDVRWASDLAPRTVLETNAVAPITALALARDERTCLLGFANGAIGLYPVELSWNDAEAGVTL
jgi:hypothetical protein